MDRLAILSSLAILMFLSGRARAEPSCGSVIIAVTPCLSYLKGSSVTPAANCCSGISNVSGMIKNKSDRTAVCQCLKNGLAKAGNYDPALLPKLPQICHVSVNLPAIDKNTNCATA